MLKHYGIATQLTARSLMMRLRRGDCNAVGADATPAPQTPESVEQAAIICAVLTPLSAFRPCFRAEAGRFVAGGADHRDDFNARRLPTVVPDGGESGSRKSPRSR